MGIAIANPIKARASHTGVLYPSGRFSITRCPREKRVHSSSVLTNDEKKNLCNLSAGDGVLYAGRKASSAPLLGLYVLARTALPETDGRGEAIGLSASVISRKRRPRGSRGMTKTAGDVLKWAAGALEDNCPPGSIGFLTVTLPSDDIGFLRDCQQQWQRIVKNFIESLKRELKKNGCNIPTILGCVELHPSRSSRLGVNVPHIHAIFRCRERPGKPYYISPGNVRALWRRAVVCATGCTGIDFGATENLVVVRRSVRRYLGKYLSKRPGGVAGEGGRDSWFPSSYTIVPRLIRSAYRSATIRSPKLIGMLEDSIAALRPGRGYVRVFHLDTGGRKVPWATYGYLDELYRPPPQELFTDNVVRRRPASKNEYNRINIDSI